MPARTDKVLWLDLETTGSSDDAQVLEIGMAVTGPGPKFLIEAATNIIITPKSMQFESPVVEDMHTKNGLIRDCIERGLSNGQAEVAISDFLRAHLGEPKPHDVVLAGSGVSHFDRKYIKRDWPWFDQWLAYYSYDVGSLRRFMRMVGIEAGIDQENTPHRALEDVFQHIREARSLLLQAGGVRE